MRQWRVGHALDIDIFFEAHLDLQRVKDRAGKQTARINPHPHAADGSLQPI